MNEETHTAKGTITFVPKGESSSVCEIQPYNPTVIGENPIGFVDGMQKSVNLKVYYGAYSYVIEPLSRTGDFSHYNASTRTLYVGDGETVGFTVKSPTQKLATPKEVKVFFTPSMDTDKVDGSGNTMYYKTSASSPKTTFMWRNCGQESERSGVLNAGVTQYSINLLDDVVPATTAMVTKSGVITDIVKVGYITVKYIPVYQDTQEQYQFPVYVEVHGNCIAKNAGFGSNKMTD